MKLRYIVSIEETISEDFEVYAETREDALEIAAKRYKNCEFVLDPGNLIYKQMAITFPEEKASTWAEF